MQSSSNEVHGHGFRAFVLHKVAGDQSQEGVEGSQINGHGNLHEIQDWYKQNMSMPMRHVHIDIDIVCCV